MLPCKLIPKAHFAIRPRPTRNDRKSVATGRQCHGFVLFEYDLSAKWLELLKEIAPDVGLTADCPKKKAHNWNDQCAARCPDLPRVM